MNSDRGHCFFQRHLLRLSCAAIAGLAVSACSGASQVATVNTPDAPASATLPSAIPVATEVPTAILVTTPVSTPLSPTPPQPTDTPTPKSTVTWTPTNTPTPTDTATATLAPTDTPTKLPDSPTLAPTKPPIPTETIRPTDTSVPNFYSQVDLNNGGFDGYTYVNGREGQGGAPYDVITIDNPSISPEDRAVLAALPDETIKGMIKGTVMGPADMDSDPPFWNIRGHPDIVLPPQVKLPVRFGEWLYISNDMIDFLENNRGNGAWYAGGINVFDTVNPYHLVSALVWDPKYPGYLTLNVNGGPGPIRPVTNAPKIKPDTWQLWEVAIDPNNTISAYSDGKLVSQYSIPTDKVDLQDGKVVIRGVHGGPIYMGAKAPSSPPIGAEVYASGLTIRSW